MTTTIGRPLPRAIGRRFWRALLPMLRQADATIAQIETVAQARAIGPALRAAWPDARLRAIVLAALTDAERAASRPWAALERRRGALGYAAPVLIGRAVTGAAGLLMRLRDSVAPSLVQALREGPPPATAPARGGTLRGRVSVLAQDAPHRLAAEVQAARAGAFGIEEFVWRTQGDSRVRQRHRDLDGSRWRYDDPPDEGLPGQPVNCRCWAASVLDT